MPRHPALTVSQFMTPSTALAEPGENLGAARQLMRRRQLRELPVVREGQLVGMLSLRELDALERSHPELSLEAMTVEEALRPDMVWVLPDAPSDRVAALMYERDIRAVVVMDGPRIVGTFTAADALRSLAGERAPGLHAASKAA